MIYLDNNATTPLHPKVKEVIKETLDYYSNPSSLYTNGRVIREKINNARKEIATFLNCKPNEIIFTSCGSESNNTVLKGVINNYLKDGNKNKVHIITSIIEHPSIINTLKSLESENVEVTYLNVDENGMVNIENLKKSIKKETVLISIMFANNEIGTIEPIEDISKIALENNILFHTDAVQAIGKVDIDLKKLKVDYLSLSGHKIYAPKGIGVIFEREGSIHIPPLINGGHQENGLRAGTENVIGIIALGEAFRMLKLEMKDEIKKVKELRELLESEIVKNIPDIKINGHPTMRLAGTLNVSFKKIEGESILLRLDFNKIAVSTGSACSSGSLDPSPVIMALGVSPEIAHSSIRFSLGRENTKEEILKTVEILKESVEFLRMMSPIK